LSSLCLPVRIGPDAAVQRFNKRKLKNLYGLLAREIRIAAPDDSASRRPPFIERLWLPAYAVLVHTRLREKENRVWTSVDGLSGYFAFLDDINLLKSTEPTEDAFPPTVTPDQAEKAARRGLLQFILRQRGQLNKPVIDAVEEIRLYHFPVWVLYRRHLRNRIDLQVLDAFTGSPGGAKMRVAVINALIDAHKQRQPAEEP
jgi:hypothetical protein